MAPVEPAAPTSTSGSARTAPAGRGAGREQPAEVEDSGELTRSRRTRRTRRPIDEPEPAAPADFEADEPEAAAEPTRSRRSRRTRRGAEPFEPETVVEDAAEAESDDEDEEDGDEEVDATGRRRRRRGRRGRGRGKGPYDEVDGEEPAAAETVDDAG